MNYEDLFAGRCIFTISNNKDQHYTFKVDKIGKYDRWIVKLLTGPDNTKDYTYLGMLWDRSIKPVSLTAKSSFNKDSIPYKVFVYVQEVLSNQKKLPNDYNLLGSGRCYRCGRTLTTPESILSGYGPECIKRL